ncbi:hypothetical protein GALL_371530 [mine drainage metagenome]|uniref:Uncharacterized protein n=1 Tax=mine drainage metagenome TaxID=410659 RepID=A0A1J5QYW0_9ZZZZ
MLGVVEARLDLRSVVAQEVGRFAHFADRRRQRAAGFAHDQSDQARQPFLEQFGGAAQDRGALGRRRGLPHRRGLQRQFVGAVDQRGVGFDDMADDVACVGRVEHRTLAARAFAVGQQRVRAPAHVEAGQPGRGQRTQALLVAEVESRRVLAQRAEQRARQGDLRVRRADRLDAPGELDRVGDDVVEIGFGVVDLVHERGVGAVLEQAANQVGEQRLVGAHRRVDAARPVHRRRTDDFLVQRLAHAVQALELVLADVEVLARHRVDRSDRVRVVRGELREYRVGRRQQAARARQVGHVGVHLARVDGEVLEPVELRALDFRIPVRALDQAHHQPPARALRQVDQEVEHEGRAFLVGLHDETDAVPALQAGVETQALEQVQRQLEAVGFLGVDVQPDVVAARQPRQLLQPRQQLVHHALALGARVARVQRRQLDRDARAFVDAAALRRLADGVDRLLVVAQVARRVGCGQRGLAEHVVGVAEAARFPFAAVGQRFGDGLAEHELLAHQPHRHVDAAAHHRLAAASDQSRERRRQPRLAARRGQLAGQQQAPGGRVDEQRAAAAEVALPVAGADLVADQRVARRGVGDAQQRFGQAHQRDAFLARQCVLLQQGLDDAAALLAAQPLSQRARGVGRCGRQLRRQRRLLDQRGDAFGFGSAVGRGDRRAQHGLRLHVLRQFEEGHHRRFGHRRRRRAQLAVVAVVDLQRVAVLEPFQSLQDQLLDDVVRRAAMGLCRRLDAQADLFVEFHTDRRDGHGYTFLALDRRMVAPFF